VARNYGYDPSGNYGTLAKSAQDFNQGPLLPRQVYGNNAINIRDTANPSGIVQAYGGDNPPDGWLICDGSLYSRNSYPKLFAVIGKKYGGSDVANTFGVPNLKGRVPVGLDLTQTEFDVLGETGGEKTHTLTPTEMPAHTHDYAWGEGAAAAGGSFTSMINVGFDHPRATTSAGSGGAHNNLQPYEVVNFIIKI
jgi:microcystin-dependent protein